MANDCKRFLWHAHFFCFIFLYLPSIFIFSILSSGDPDVLLASDLTAGRINPQALELIRAEEYDSAIVLLENQIAIDGSDSEILFLLGNAHDMNDNIPGAIALYHRSIQTDSSYWPPYRYLGYLFDIFASYDSMNYYLGMAIALGPSPDSAYYDYAYSFDMLGQEDSALLYYHRAVQFDSLDSQAKLNIGAIWGRRNKLDSAGFYTRQAVLIEPDAPAACYNLAEILIVEKRHEEAIDQFQKALALDPNLVAAKKRLGELYEVLGDSTMAELYFRDFVDTAPIIYLDDINEIKSKLSDNY